MAQRPRNSSKATRPKGERSKKSLSPTTRSATGRSAKGQRDASAGVRFTAPDDKKRRGFASAPRGPRAADATQPSDRIQKLLSAAGIGSRREVERWIREGRLKINDQVPALGARLMPRDRLTLDDRPVRLRSETGKAQNVLLFHRSPGEPLDIKAATSRAAKLLELPRSQGRWLAIQAMPPVDGGLELLTDDGSWANQVSRGAHALTVDYVLRMRGPLNDELVETFRAATDHEGEPLQIIQAEAQYGAGANHWLNLTVRASRPASVRHWWAARGVIVSRLMRVRFGPVHLSRDLPRGHSRAMLMSERNALMNEVAAAAAAASAAAAPDSKGEAD